MFDRMQAFTNEEMTRIHDSAMEILRDVGVAFHEPEALEIFKNHGAKVKGDVVFLEEKMVTMALENAPSRFHLTGRNPDRSVWIGENDFVLVPGYGAPFIITPEGEQRLGTLDDYNNFCKLVQSSKYLDMNGFLMAEPSDVPTETAYLDMMFSSLTLCDRPFMGSPVTRQAAVDAVEMAAIVFGGKEEIAEHPVMLPIISVIAPLQYSEEMAGSLIEFARAGQPILDASLVMAGSSGPVTLAGVLALQNAEVLAGLTLAQLVRPGIPYIYGATSCPIDMKTGALAIGAVENAMLVSATAQMARFYNLPSRSGGALTDAHFPDIQAGMESAMSLLTAIRSGINFVLHACGILGSFVEMSFEKFLADEELCGMVKKMHKPIDMSDEAIDLPMIKDVGIGGQYLTQPKTFQLCRTEFFVPDLIKRQSYDSWKGAGKKRLDQEATEGLARRLDGYEKPDMDPAIEHDLAKFVAGRKG
ncbi:MAG: trimethylamine methyltransferase [Deltaproteobacteria bacterium]|nr:trimethylamine methyltransferase [Deltaproteobacteria bacterium]